MSILPISNSCCVFTSRKAYLSSESFRMQQQLLGILLHHTVQQSKPQEQHFQFWRKKGMYPCIRCLHQKSDTSKVRPRPRMAQETRCLHTRGISTMMLHVLHFVKIHLCTSPPQIFHCLQPDNAGGDTLLVDGFKVAEELANRDPAAFKVLCKTPVPFQHTSSGV